MEIPNKLVMEPGITPKPVNWLSKEFVPVEELFPLWHTARIMLTRFHKETLGWSANTVSSELNLGLVFPEVIDKLSGEKVPMIKSFPIEDQPKVEGICLSLMKDYVPNLDKYYNMKSTPEISVMVMHEIEAREKYILDCGGSKWKDELAYRLGLSMFHGFNED